MFRITGDTIEAFRPSDSITSQAVWSLLAEPDGTVWAGTFRGGLLRLSNGKFTRFSLNEGLPDNVICQILEDDAGNLWLGSHRGILQVKKSELNRFARGETNAITATEFGRSDGLPSLESSGSYQPAAWRSQEGRLWFTTVKGAVSVQPQNIRPNRLPPPVVIEDIFVDGTNMDASGTAGGKPVLISNGGTATYAREKAALEVSPGKHQLEFRYTGLSLVSVRSGAISATGWKEPIPIDRCGQSARWHKYNLLPAGTYAFRVIACNSDGADLESPGRHAAIAHFAAYLRKPGGSDCWRQ